jgi:hypothetical protein
LNRAGAGYFASGPGLSYMRDMAIFPRPVSPRSALGDMWSYFRMPRPHKWPLLGLSAAITYVIVWAFVVDANTNTMPTRNQIIYVKNWDPKQTDAAIILQQKMDLARNEVALQQHQKDMQKMADMFGIEWKSEEARNTARRKEALKMINAQLDARLAKAEAEEKQAPAGQP